MWPQFNNPTKKPQTKYQKKKENFWTLKKTEEKLIIIKRKTLHCISKSLEKFRKLGKIKKK